MKGKGRSRQAILAAVTVLAAAQAGTAYASTGPASESGVQTGAWIQEGQDWKYQGTDGTLKTGWVKTESGWYYLDPQSGRMMTGWITVDGRRYYMNTTADGVEGQMRRGWWKDNAGKWANRNKWLKTHILNNNFYDVLRLKTVEKCHANLPSEMILARYFYAIIEMCVSSITG